jgi:uncharacterized secreted protein with C-terminal beta-propeller domain
MHSRLLIFSTLLMVLALTACNQDSGTATPIQQTALTQSQVALRAVTGCDDLKQQFVDNWVENLLAGYRYQFPVNETIIVAPTEDAAVNTDGVATDVAPDNVSQTNTQEAGVDEADTVKTDSQGNLYIAQHDKLVIADAFPPQTMNIRATLELGGWSSGLYLAEDQNTVAVLVSHNVLFGDPVITEGQDLAILPYIKNIPQTDLLLIDISNPDLPEITQRIRLDGQLVSSRIIGNRLHLIQSYYLGGYNMPDDGRIPALLEQYRDAYLKDDESRMDNIRQQVRQLVEAGLDFDSVASLLPKVTISGSQVDTQTQTLSCSDVYRPEVDLTQNHLLTITSIDINGDNLQQVAALGSGWISYVSQQDLFIVQPGNYWWGLRNQQQQSAIHHFSISDQKPEYVSTGMVKGYPQNSFSLSYYKDYLRVVTTQNVWNLDDRSDIRSTNHLFVLEDNVQQSMDIVSSVENFANNEAIFSARFVGDRAYVVTFRQIDPLFSFDLSDPLRPFIAGELKIPGFSSYMHPIGETHLLTIGQDGSDAGSINQIAIKLFDVSDLAAPVLVDSYTPEMKSGYSWSQASWDHHAFTYYEPLQMLVVPIASYDNASDDVFMGMLALDIDLQQGLSLAGKIDHNDLARQVSSCQVAENSCNAYYYGWLAQPTRSIFMSSGSDNYLFSLSNIGVKAVNVNDFDTAAGSLLLPSAEPFYSIYY